MGDPQMMQNLAQNNPIAQLFRLLQQNIDSMGNGSSIPATIPGLPQVMERLQGISNQGRSVASGGYSSGSAMNGLPGGPLLDAVVQPAMAGVSAAATAVGNVVGGGSSGSL